VTSELAPDTRSSDALYERATRVMPGGNTRSTLHIAPHAPFAVSGRGCRLTDADGHTMLDAQNNFTSLIHGHLNPHVTEAIRSSLTDLISVGLPTQWDVALAELLSGRVAEAEQWRFANSGTETVMFAIRLARGITGRQKIIKFAGAYHGSYDAVIPADHRGASRSMAEDTITLPFDEVEPIVAAMKEHGSEVAAVLIDVMPNRAGLRLCSEAFALEVQRLCRKYDIVLIADEILTFRCAVGGLYTVVGLQPDIVTLGKIIGGGLPIGAVGGRRELMGHFDPRRADAIDHSGTFSANPLTMRAGFAAMEIFGGDEMATLSRFGDHVRHQLGAQGWNVTGHGSLFRVHAEDPAALWWAAYHHGVLLAKNGLGCLSTAMQEHDVDEISSVFSSIRSEGIA